MKKKGSSIFILCTILMNLMLSTSVSSVAASAKPCDVMNKSEFADSISTLPTKYDSTIYTIEEKASVLSEFIIDGFTVDELFQLEEMGVYLYDYDTEIESEEFRNNRAVGTTDQVDQERPAIGYDSYSDEWTVVAGGKWNDISWVPNSNGNIGGYEVVGFTFNDSNIGKLSNARFPEYTSIIGSLMAPTASSTSDREVVNYDDYFGNERKGMGCQLQDRSISEGWFQDGHYVGQNFAVVVTYDNRFKNVTGAIRGFYTHTGTDCSLSSVGFSGSSSGEVGVSAEFTVSDAGFTENSLRRTLWKLIIPLTLIIAITYIIFLKIYKKRKIKY